MSDFEDSTITYTIVSSPFGGLSDIRSLGVDGPPPGPDHPPLPVYVPEFVPEPIYPEFMSAEDDILPAEEEPMPTAASPTTESLGYIDESNLDKDPKEDLADYPADGGDEGDDEDESSDDDEDDDIDIEGDEEEAEAKRGEIPKVDLPLRKRLCTAHTSTYELGESFVVATARLGEPVRDDHYRDMRYHAQTASLIEGEARASPYRGFQTTVEIQQEEIRELQAADRKLQVKLIQALTALKSCQTQLSAALGRIPILDASRVPAQPEGVAKALTARDADRNTNDDDNHVSRTDLKKKMTDKYCPRGEMKKLKSKLWNLRVKSNDVQQQNKRQNTNRAYTVGSGKKKPYRGSKPLCPKCNYHHDGLCAPKCHKCNKVGHFACNCRSTSNVNTTNNQRGNGMSQKPTCYECGAQGQFKKDCPKLKNNNRGTQGGNATAPEKLYAVGRARTNPDSNVITGTFLLNNCYASILFDTSADRSFVSIAFSSQIEITPTTLDQYYDVELADGRIIREDCSHSLGK
nr:hypothetical protein [Tanacetum cinerariifolium]